MKMTLESTIKISILATIALFPLSIAVGFVGMGVALILALIKGDGDKLLKLVWTDKPLLLVMVSFALAICFSKFFLVSLGFGIFGSGQIMLYLLVRAYLRDNRLIKHAIYLTLFCSIIVSAIGIYQYYFTPMDAVAQGWIDGKLYKDIPVRVFSTLYNPNVLGSYLIFIIATALGCLDFANRWRGIILAVVIVAAVLCLLFTYSRGAWLGLAGSIFLFLCWRKEKKYLLGMLAVIAIALLADYHQLWARLNPITLKQDTSMAYRLEIWQSAFRIFQDHPFFGTGWGTTWFYIPQYSRSISTFIAHCHNLYLHLAVEAGFFSLVSFLILAGSIMLMSYDVYRHSRSPRQRGIALGLLVGFTGIMIQGFVDAAITSPQFGMLFWIYCGIVKNLWEMGKKNQLNDVVDTPHDSPSAGLNLHG